MWTSSGIDCINGDVECTIRTVFESNGAGQAGSQFSVTLAFGGARTNRSLADQVGNILRTDEIEIFCTRGYTLFGQVQ